MLKIGDSDIQQMINRNPTILEYFLIIAMKKETINKNPPI